MRRLIVFFLLFSATCYGQDMVGDSLILFDSAGTPTLNIFDPGKAADGKYARSSDTTGTLKWSDLYWTDLIGVPVADASTSGILRNPDWITFNNKQNAITTSNIASYAPTSHTVVDGTLSTGTYANLAVQDGDYMVVREQGDAEPLTVILDYTGIVEINQIAVFGRHVGGTAHLVSIQLYNYPSATWDTFASFAPSATDAWYSATIIDDSSYTSGGLARVRLYQVNSGNTGHYLWLDYAKLNFSIAGGGGVTAHPALSGRDVPDAHPAAAITATSSGTLTGTTVEEQITQLNSLKQDILTSYTAAPHTQAGSTITSAVSDATSASVANTANIAPWAGLTGIPYADGSTTGVQRAIDWTHFQAGYTHSTATTNVHGLTFTGEGAGGGLDADTVDSLHANSFQTSDTELSALAGLDATAGILAQTGAGSFVRRTITGTANQVTVTTGTGQTGNPTISLPSSVALGTASTTRGIVDLYGNSTWYGGMLRLWNSAGNNPTNGFYITPEDVLLKFYNTSGTLLMSIRIDDGSVNSSGNFRVSGGTIQDSAAYSIFTMNPTSHTVYANYGLGVGVAVESEAISKTPESTGAAYGWRLGTDVTGALIYDDGAGLRIDGKTTGTALFNWGGGMTVRLGDAAAKYKFTLQDSASTSQTTIDSDGNAWFAGSLNNTGDSFTSGSRTTLGTSLTSGTATARDSVCSNTLRVDGPTTLTQRVTLRADLVSSGTAPTGGWYGSSTGTICGGSKSGWLSQAFSAFDTVFNDRDIVFTLVYPAAFPAGSSPVITPRNDAAADILLASPLYYTGTAGSCVVRTRYGQTVYAGTTCEWNYNIEGY